VKGPTLASLIGQLMDRDPDLRAQACSGLAERAIPTTGALLLPALADDDEAVREAAATAAGHVRGPGARRALERVVRADRSPRVVDAAATALRALDGEPVAGSPVGPTLPRVVPGAPGASPLATPPIPLTPAEALECVSWPDPGTRAAALALLGTCSDAAAGPPLVAALEDPVPLVRAHAAAALVGHPMARATDRLLELMDDEDPEVRRHCARALGAMRSPEAYPALTLALADDFQSVRIEAAAALARIGGDRVRRELHHAARTWVPGSVPVITALETLDEDVGSEVEEWLEHPYEGVRGVALDWVVARRARQHVELVERLVDDPEPWLADEARDALRRLR
jgi:HEAT repeat protein